ncbi:MAG: MoaD family protein [Desulfurococcales archaeon]|nr:MoaD family protein [Desulfurococcales archaeon]
MRVTVRVYATLIRVAGGRIHRLDLPEGASVADALRAVSLYDVVTSGGRVRRFYKVLLNGRDIDFVGGLGARLGEGDEIDVFPPLAGG